MAYRRKDVNRGANTSTNTRRRRKGSGRKGKKLYEDRNVSIEDLGKSYLVKYQPIPSERRAGIKGLQTITVPKSTSTQAQNQSYCGSMWWGSSFEFDAMSPEEQDASTPENLPFGPTINLHLYPPLFGGFQDISGQDFSTFFGTTDANGNYFLGASAKLDFMMNFGHSGNTSLLHLPMMTYYFLVLSGKAKIIRFNGDTQELYFQVKNLDHMLTYYPQQPDGDGGFGLGGVGGGSGPFGNNTFGGTVIPNPNPLAQATSMFVRSENQIPISDCFYYMNTIEPVNPSNTTSSVELGAGGYTGLKLINDFYYGDKILIENIEAGFPGLAIPGCAGIFGIDADGDGEIDNYYGPGVEQPRMSTFIPSDEKQFSITT